MKIDKIAEKDAFDWARAEMFFGKGAGTQRKLLWAEIADKIFKIPGYAEAFNKAYSKQDMAEHAIKAAKMRKSIDRSAALNRNTRALIHGNRRNLSPVLAAIVIGGAYAHQNGYDQIALDKAKKHYAKAQARVRLFRAAHNI